MYQTDCFLVSARWLGRFAAIALLGVIQAKTLTVTTVDSVNPSPGSLSLAQAITDAANGDTIGFNIPGAGPHYLVTPIDGYPVVTQHRLTIDGFTQPGSKPNTNSLTRANSADIRIVLDSRDGGSTILDYPGFSQRESAVLGVVGGTNFLLRGVSILAIPGEDTSASPYIYGVALIRDALNAKIQGCWFGIDPAVKSFTPGVDGKVPGIFGGRSGIAAFRWNDGGPSLTASGLIVGTDSDGVTDHGEFNVFCGQLLALNLETPQVTIAGNYFNYLPNGTVFDHSKQGIAVGDGETYENIENGMAHHFRIGTDGNGINDTNEVNFLGPVRYDTQIELWGPATNVVIAGNYLGIGPSNTRTFVSPATTSFVRIRHDSTIRIGSDLNGNAGDLLEANSLAGIRGDLLLLDPDNGEPGNRPARVSLRNNRWIDFSNPIPVRDTDRLTVAQFYVGVLANPSADLLPVLGTNSFPTSLVGRIPASVPDNLVPGSFVELDLYLADPISATNRSPLAPNGIVAGQTYLGTYSVDAANDLDPNPSIFRFDVSSLKLGIADLRRLTCTANFRLKSGGVSTTGFALPLGDKAREKPADPIVAKWIKSGANITLQWTGGFPPYRVQRKLSITDPTWADLLSTSQNSMALNPTNRTGFFRIAQ